MKISKLARARKSAKSLPHPKDRKVDQFQRKIRRNVRISGQAEVRKQADQARCSRFFWIRSQLQALGGKAVSMSEASLLAQLFVCRNDEERIELQKLRNPPRGRIKFLQGVKDREDDELKSSTGFLIPDIITTDGATILTTVWDGELATIGCIPTIHVKALPSCEETKNASDSLSAQLKSAGEVRDEQQRETKTSVRLQRFCKAGKKLCKSTLAERNAKRRISVKSFASTAERREERRANLALRSITAAQQRRHAAIALSRGLFQ
jgi:hypothetical protein